MEKQLADGDLEQINAVVDEFVLENAAVEKRRRQANVEYGPGALGEMIGREASGYVAEQSAAMGQCLRDAGVGRPADLAELSEEELRAVLRDGGFALSDIMFRQVCKIYRDDTVKTYIIEVGACEMARHAIDEARAMGRSVSQSQMRRAMVSHLRGQSMSVDRRDIGRSQSLQREEGDEEVFYGRRVRETKPVDEVARSGEGAAQGHTVASDNDAQYSPAVQSGAGGDPVARQVEAVRREMSTEEGEVAAAKDGGSQQREPIKVGQEMWCSTGGQTIYVEVQAVHYDDPDGLYYTVVTEFGVEKQVLEKQLQWHRMSDAEIAKLNEKRIDQHHRGDPACS